MNYNELKVYKIAKKLGDELYKNLKQIPFNWENKQVDQLKRSSFSITANIVEGFSRKFYKKDFIKFLNTALGSSDESQEHLRVLYIQKHLNDDQFDYFYKNYKDLSIRILNFINYLRSK
jgi:four helix bundle protein